jgi:hypothetical protein
MWQRVKISDATRGWTETLWHKPERDVPSGVTCFTFD